MTRPILWDASYIPLALIIMQSISRCAMSCTTHLIIRPRCKHDCFLFTQIKEEEEIDWRKLSCLYYPRLQYVYIYIGPPHFLPPTQVLHYQFKGKIFAILNQHLKETLSNVILKWTNLAGILTRLPGEQLVVVLPASKVVGSWKGGEIQRRMLLDLHLFTHSRSEVIMWTIFSIIEIIFVT